ncbi:SET and MYND domain-containing protein 3 [Xanthoria calcicola]
MFSHSCQSRSWAGFHKYECKILGRLYPQVPPSLVRMVMQLLLRKKADALSDSEWNDFLRTVDHVDHLKKDSTKGGLSHDRWHDVQLMSQAAHRYSGTNESLILVQSMMARSLVNSMTVTDGTGSTLGTCLSTAAALLNHSCNPSCVFIFSGASLSIRSLRPIPANAELTISYTDITKPSHRRQVDLRSMYYFKCTCEYCTKKLTCGLPDVPTALEKGLSSAKILDLEAEGERLQCLASDATPANKIKLLDQAMVLLVPYKDIYPVWRHPWPSIRDEVKLLHWNLDHWSLATVHALKAYFFIDPMLYPNAWHPVRIQRVFVLFKLIRELQYQIYVSPDDRVEGDLRKYNIQWLSVNMGLEGEIEAAIPKGFGTESSFAEEYRRLPKSESPEKWGMKVDWVGERAKLERAAREIAD